MNRCVILGGASISNYELIKTKLKDDDFFICCDSGLKHTDKLGITPNLIIGDFDSHENPMLEIETIVLPCKKDDTDSAYAVKEAIKRGFDSFLLLGVIGNRFDHTMGNISLLLKLDSQKKKAVAIDDFSELLIISDNTETIDDSYSFFSLICMDAKAESVTIENAKYPLTDSEINYEYQYGISNEVLKGSKAKVSVKNGRLLLIKVF